MNDAELSRLLIVVADTIERQALVNQAGIVRQAARRIAGLPTKHLPGACLGCGVALIQPQHAGRRRKWCGKGRCVARRIVENPKLVPVDQNDEGRGDGRMVGCAGRQAQAGAGPAAAEAGG